MELITFQSKARHQIMIELRESQQLLKEATSEKAVKFWNHHIDVLLNKLDAIDQEKEEDHRGSNDSSAISHYRYNHSRINQRSFNAIHSDEDCVAIG